MDIKRGFEAGCDHYMTKPYKLQDLHSVIREHLQTDLKRKVILCVDDKPDNLDLLEQALGKSYRIIKEKNCFDAIQSLYHHNPDLLIVNYEMPDMNGLVFCKAIRKDFGRLPIILVSSYKLDEVEVRREGITQLMIKPIKVNEIRKTVAELI
jgi:CheY-like chemotaxis protein